PVTCSAARRPVLDLGKVQLPAPPPRGLLVARRETPLRYFSSTKRRSTRLHRRDPSFENHPTRARHRQQVAVPRRLRRVAGHPVVLAVLADESLKVGDQGHPLWISLHRGAGRVYGRRPGKCLIPSTCIGRNTRTSQALLRPSAGISDR